MKRSIKKDVERSTIKDVERSTKKKYQKRVKNEKKKGEVIWKERSEHAESRKKKENCKKGLKKKK